MYETKKPVQEVPVAWIGNKEHDVDRSVSQVSAKNNFMYVNPNNSLSKKIIQNHVHFDK